MSKLKTIFNRGIRRPWDKSILVAAMFTFVAGAFWFGFLKRDRVYSDQDLKLVTGRLRNYAFVDGYRGSHQYYLYLAGYSPRFQIQANDLGLFSKYSFDKSVHIGDQITLGIPLDSFRNKINSNGRIHLFSIQKGEEYFMRSGGVIQSNNSLLPITLGSLFLLASLGIVIARGMGMKDR